jgi:hypothetical protein
MKVLAARSRVLHGMDGEVARSDMLLDLSSEGALEPAVAGSLWSGVVVTDHEPNVAVAAGPNHRGIRVSIVKPPWAAKQRPGLPDAPGVEYHTCSGADSGAAGPACGLSSHSLKMCPGERPGRDLDVQPRPSDLGVLLASVRRIQAASWRCPAAAVIVTKSTRGTGRKPYLRCLAPPLEQSERAEQILASRRLAVADEVGELSQRSHCAENRKSVLIEYARSRSDSVRRSGCRRSASCRSFVGARETLPLLAEQDHLRRDLLR